MTYDAATMKQLQAGSGRPGMGLSRSERPLFESLISFKDETAVLKQTLKFSVLANQFCAITTTLPIVA